MISVSTGFLSIIMSTVLTVSMVEEAIPPGTERAVVEAYFADIGGVSIWMPRGSREADFRNFPWREDEVGLITSGAIHNVRERWWWPSFGRFVIIQAGISSDGHVTQVRIREGMIGWP